jgi:hypothetical protein
MNLTVLTPRVDAIQKSTHHTGLLLQSVNVLNVPLIDESVPRFRSNFLSEKEFSLFYHQKRARTSSTVAHDPDLSFSALVRDTSVVMKARDFSGVP